MTIDEIIDLAERGVSSELQRNSIIKSRGEEKFDYGRTWTLETFLDYMNRLVGEARARSSVGDLLALLVAYLETTSRPTSEEIRIARGFGPGEQWYEELRTTKARLTIAAKHLGLPSFFLRAYGSGLNRRHPMDEKVYSFLTEWGKNNRDLVQEFKMAATPRSAE